jgi:hypothetical protein
MVVGKCVRIGWDAAQLSCGLQLGKNHVLRQQSRVCPVASLPWHRLLPQGYCCLLFFCTEHSCEC